LVYLGPYKKQAQAIVAGNEGIRNPAHARRSTPLHSLNKRFVFSD
jgi:hypothetical protein